ncbi:MAG: hypothetical protein JXR06_02140 [Candidatus Atelocyanobacterium thalassa]
MKFDFPSSNDIHSAINNSDIFNFNLPNPEDIEIEEIDFQKQLNMVWEVCDRFDLQTDIWRGRILRAARDREKKQGNNLKTGFIHWLKEREISKNQAYRLIQLAESADKLFEEGDLCIDSINNFSKRAFIETAKSEPEVQKIISEAAKNGDHITCREVKQLSDEWSTMSSDVLPTKIKDKIEQGILMSHHVAPLVQAMKSLPDCHLKSIQKEVFKNSEIDNIKLLTKDSKNLAKCLDAAAQLQTLKNEKIHLDIEMVLEESIRLDCLNTTVNLIQQASQLEQIVVKFYIAWKRLKNISDKLYINTGESSPNLRSMLTSLESLSEEVVEVPLDELREKVVKLRIFPE